MIAVKARIGTATAMMVAVLAAVGAVGMLTAASADGRPLEIDVWTSSGEDALVSIGEPVDLCFRANMRARVIVYAVDTDGWVHVVYPAERWEDNTVQGGRTYRLRNIWPGALARGPYGMVLVGAVGAREVLPAAHGFGYGDAWVFCDGESWPVSDAVPSPDVIGRVVGDPFEAVWAIEQVLAPDNCRDRGFAADFCWFHLGRRVYRPSYVCIADRDWGADVCVSVDLGWVLGWPGCVCDFHRRPRPPCRGVPVCEATGPVVRTRWKSGYEGAQQKTCNKTANSCVIESERTRAPGDERPTGKKNEAGRKPREGEVRLKERDSRGESPARSAVLAQGPVRGRTDGKAANTKAKASGGSGQSKKRR